MTRSDPRKWSGREAGVPALGSNNRSARLDEDQVIKIKQLLADGVMTHKAIADQFGVASSTITSIHHKRTWGHVRIMNEQEE